MGTYLNFLQKMVRSKSSLATTLQYATQGYKNLLTICYLGLQEPFKDLGSTDHHATERFNSCYIKAISILHCLCFKFDLIYFSFNMITYCNRFRQYLL